MISSIIETYKSALVQEGVMKSARGIRKGFTEWVVFELLMLKLVLIEKVQVYQI